MANHRLSVDKRLSQLGAKPLQQAERHLLTQLGIPSIYLDFDCHGNQSPIMKITAVFSDDQRWFSHDAHAETAFIFETKNPFDGTHDAVAFRPDVKAISFHERIPALLGLDNLLEPHASESLLAHANVLNFLRFGRSGVMVIDEQRSAALLREAGMVFFEDCKQAHAIRLASQLDNLAALKKRSRP